jgi:hypothetical protein
MPENCKVKLKENKLENLKEFKSSYSSRNMLNKAYDSIIKASDLAEKYPALRPIRTIINKAEGLYNNILSKTNDDFNTFVKLPDKEMKELIPAMVTADRLGTRLTNEFMTKEGYSQNQINAYNALRRIADSSFKDRIETKLFTSTLSKDELELATKNLDSFMEKAKVATNIKNLKRLILEDTSLSRNDRIAQLKIAREYRVGWMERNRGNGGYKLTIHDDGAGGSVKQLFRTHIGMIEGISNLQALKADGIKQAEEALKLQVENKVSVLSTKIERNNKRMLNADAETKMKIEEENKFLQEQIRKQKSRKVNPDSVKVTKIENEARDRKGLYDAMEEVKRIRDDKVKDDISKINDNSSLTKAQKEKEIKTAIKNGNAAYESILNDMKKQADASSFKRHSIHRQQDYIAGMKLDPNSIREGLLSYRHQSAKANTNILTASEAFSALQKIDDSDLRKEGRDQIEEFMRTATGFERNANKIAVASSARQFFGVAKVGIVNKMFNFANELAVMAEKGFGFADSHKIAIKANGSSGRIMAEYVASLTKKNANGESLYKNFSDFIDNSKTINALDKDTADLVKLAVKNGVTYDVLSKEFQDISKASGVIGRVYEIGMSPMTFSEKINRMSSILATADMIKRSNGKVLADAIEKGYIQDSGNILETSLAFAEHISGKVNGEYGAANRSRIERGSGVFAVGMRTMFPFQSYVIHQLLGLYPKYAMDTMSFALESAKKAHGTGTMTTEEFQNTVNGAKAFVLMNSYMGLTGGALSVPFFAGINAIQKSMSDEPTVFDTQKAKDNFMDELMSGGITKALMGIDLSGSSEIQVPYLSGSYLTNIWNQSDTMKQFSMGNIHKGIADNFVTPVFIKAIDAAIYDTDLLSKSGSAQIVNGTELQRSTAESISKGILGVQSSHISEEKQKIYVKKTLDKWIANEKKTLNYEYSNGTLEDDELQRFEDRIDIINSSFGLSYSYKPKEEDTKDVTINIQ